MNNTTNMSQVQTSTLSLLDRGLNVHHGHGLKDGVCTCGTDCKTPGRHHNKVKHNKQAKADVWASFEVPANICMSTSQDDIAVIKVANTKQAKINFKRFKKEFKLPKTMVINLFNSVYHIFSSTTNVAEPLKLFPGITILKVGLAIPMPPSVHVLKNGEFQTVTFSQDLPIKKLSPQCEIKIQAILDKQKIQSQVQEKAPSAVDANKSCKSTNRGKPKQRKIKVQTKQDQVQTLPPKQEKVRSSDVATKSSKPVKREKPKQRKIKKQAKPDQQKTLSSTQEKAPSVMGTKKTCKPNKRVKSKDKLGLNKQNIQSKSPDKTTSALSVKSINKPVKRYTPIETVAVKHSHTARSHITVKEYPVAMKEAREALGLTMPELANRVNMGDYALRAIESGMVEPFDNYRKKLDPVLFGNSTEQDICNLHNNITLKNV
jgi:ribosome-binding protein aMBF1 (putative translation factor)